MFGRVGGCRKTGTSLLKGHTKPHVLRVQAEMIIWKKPRSQPPGETEGTGIPWGPWKQPSWELVVSEPQQSQHYQQTPLALRHSPGCWLAGISLQVRRPHRPTPRELAPPTSGWKKLSVPMASQEIAKEAYPPCSRPVATSRGRASQPARPRVQPHLRTRPQQSAPPTIAEESIQPTQEAL